jgi:hypothetical protein
MQGSEETVLVRAGGVLTVNITKRRKRKKREREGVEDDME